MKYIYLDKINSTQLFLKELIKKQPDEYFIYTLNQIDGIGSRNNSWIGIEGNLFFSFSVYKEKLPDDLRLETSSIYFSYLLKEVLSEFGSNVFIKWPNDFYIKDKKIGGTITNLVGSFVVCGTGLNLKKVNDQFGFLDIEIKIKNLIDKYVEKIRTQKKWNEIFRNFKNDFEKNKNFFVTIEGRKISLKRAILNNDGSILIDGKKIFSLR